jgi:single-stranded-DNA-specific exonuclease
VSSPKIELRDVPPRTVFALEQAGVHPLLARLFAARGVKTHDELDDALAHLLPPSSMKGTPEAAALLADAITQQRRICIVADYDCDGATACAVAMRGLAMLGAAPGTLSYVVPDRTVHGYGLTPPIVDLALAHQPHLLVTVDNGIASFDGVAHARACGLDVLVTDHHLPALVDGVVQLPDASCIVNPNQPGCGFASKSIAGVGVMFYVLLATRAELRARGRFDAVRAGPSQADHAPLGGAGAQRPGGQVKQPKLDALLDLVALGTVADVVKLDGNNRRLVAHGIKRIRAGRMSAGLAALYAVSKREPTRAAAFDFGFTLGPRINAAGRLADMTLGIECLVTDDAPRAADLAQQLDAINRERREVEAGMREQAELALEHLMPEGEPPPALALFDPEFHEGVVGIVAGRLKDRLHRPTFVFALAQDGSLKGSGRSIPGFHLRDALDLVAKRHPGVLKRFGGHAMAAGCTLDEDRFDAFDAALQQVAREWLDAATLTRRVFTDGPLALEYFNCETVATLDGQVWGQAFEAPVFCDEVEVLQQRLVADKHLKLRIKHQGRIRDAIWFGRVEPVAERVRLAYRLALDEWNGQQRVQMVVEAVAD